MKPTKRIKDGKVAVLVSPGHGAGWSTWADEANGLREFVLFDEGLIALKESGADEQTALNYVNEMFGPKKTYLYGGGWEDTVIVWIPEGNRFIVSEYDGFESIQFVDSISYTA